MKRIEFDPSQYDLKGGAEGLAAHGHASHLE